jgi:ATP-dependent Lhr-like helicase
LLLDRYGILFRQILARELAPFQWRSIFRALRLMEFSGEVIAGCFFDKLAGLQFVSPRMLRLLGGKLDRDCVYWICAQDPASICGLGIDAQKDILPRRYSGNYLVYLGNRLAMVASRNGKRLRVHLPAGHERLADCFILFDHLLGRSIDPLKSIIVGTINDMNAADSPLVEVLRQRFDIVVEAPKVIVYRRVTRN